MICENKECVCVSLSSSSPCPPCVYCPVSVWPRLQSSQEKPHWLRVDFDHWEELSDGGEEREDEEDETEGEKKSLSRERLEKIKEKQVIKRPQHGGVWFTCFIQAKMMTEMNKVKREAGELQKSWYPLQNTMIIP